VQVAVGDDQVVLGDGAPDVQVEVAV